ncbi:MAG: hypothetical protein QXN15_06590 [Candidatus Jordarchaeales archaeon]|nr:hypothetical protein [Candidatus Jordarchaeia archaeon]
MMWVCSWRLMVKCKAPIALADCSVLVLASMGGGKAVFRRRRRSWRRLKGKNH